MTATPCPTLKKKQASRHEEFKSPKTGNVFSIRPWKAQDRDAVASIISSTLQEYGLLFDDEGADKDAVQVETFYENNGGEFYVVTTGSTIVGSGGFLPAKCEGGNVKAVEIRKMYLDRRWRGNGLGKRLLAFLEKRVRTRGYSVALVETANVLKEACGLYVACGYREGWPDECGEGETARCDAIYSKVLEDEDTIS